MDGCLERLDRQFYAWQRVNREERGSTGPAPFEEERPKIQTEPEGLLNFKVVFSMVQVFV